MGRDPVGCGDAMVDRAQIHQTAIVEDGVRVGPGTAIWDGAHLRSGAVIGRDCIIGEKSYVAYDVQIGDRCKLNACVYVCAGVTLEDGVMIANLIQVYFGKANNAPLATALAVSSMLIVASISLVIFIVGRRLGGRSR